MKKVLRDFLIFGGRCENGESLFQGALREGAEELTGFLGNEYSVNKHIKEKWRIL